MKSSVSVAVGGEELHHVGDRLRVLQEEDVAALVERRSAFGMRSAMASPFAGGAMWSYLPHGDERRARDVAEPVEHVEAAAGVELRRARRACTSSVAGAPCMPGDHVDERPGVVVLGEVLGREATVEQLRAQRLGLVGREVGERVERVRRVVAAG